MALPAAMATVGVAADGDCDADCNVVFDGSNLISYNSV